MSPLEQKFDEWFLLKLDRDAQVRQIREWLTVPIIEAYDRQDMVEEIIVPEKLYSVVSEALEDMSFPDAYPDPDPIPDGYDRAKLSNDFKVFCKERITARNAAIEHFELPGMDNVPEHMQFIRVLTTKAKETSFIQNWDQAIGLTQSLRAKGSPINPSLAEKRLIFLLLHTLEQLGQAEQNKIQPAQEEMFIPR